MSLPISLEGDADGGGALIGGGGGALGGGGGAGGGGGGGGIAAITAAASAGMLASTSSILLDADACAPFFRYSALSAFFLSGVTGFVIHPYGALRSPSVPRATVYIVSCLFSMKKYRKTRRRRQSGVSAKVMNQSFSILSISSSEKPKWCPISWISTWRTTALRSCSVSHQ